MVNFTLRQVTTIVGEGAYQVVNSVTEASTYVYSVARQNFDHYASAADMASWPDNLATAVLMGQAFYRLPSVTRVWGTVEKMNRDLDDSVRRLQALADELTALRGALTIDRTTVIQGS